MFRSESIPNSMSETDDESVTTVFKTLKGTLSKAEKETEKLSAELKQIQNSNSYQSNEILIQKLSQMNETINMLSENLNDAIDDREKMKRQIYQGEEKLYQLRSTYKNEINKSNEEMVALRNHVCELKKEKNSSAKALHLIQQEFSAINIERHRNELSTEELIVKNEHLSKKAQDSMTQLQSERDLRNSLEQSFQALTKRVTELEVQLSQEQAQVKSLTVSLEECQSISKKRLSEGLHQEKLAKSLERQFLTAKHENEMAQDELKRLIQDKSSVTFERDSLKSHQIDQQSQQKLLQRQEKEFKETYEQLEAENKNLYVTLKKSSESLAELDHRYKEQSEKVREQEEKIKKQENCIKAMQGTAYEDRKLKRKLVERNSELEEECVVMKSKYNSTMEDLDECSVSMKEKQGKLHDENITLTQKLLLLTKKAEQNSTEHEEGRNKLEAQIVEQTMEIKELRANNRKIQKECCILQQELSKLQSMKLVTESHERQLQEILRKNKDISYENGNLKAALEDLQAEISLNDEVKGELEKVVSVCLSTEQKFQNCQGDLRELQVTHRKSEAQLRQSKELLDSKRHDLKITSKKLCEQSKEMKQITQDYELKEKSYISKIEDLKESLQTKSSEFEKLSRLINAAGKSNESLQRELECALESKKKIESSHEQQQRLIHKLRKEHLEMIQQGEAEQTEQDLRMSSLSRAFAMLEEEKQRHQRALEESLASLQSLLDAIGQIRNEKNSLSAESSRLQDELNNEKLKSERKWKEAKSKLQQTSVANQQKAVQEYQIKLEKSTKLQTRLAQSNAQLRKQVQFLQNKVKELQFCKESKFKDVQRVPTRQRNHQAILSPANNDYSLALKPQNLEQRETTAQSETMAQSESLKCKSSSRDLSLESGGDLIDRARNVLKWSQKTLDQVTKDQQDQQNPN